MLLLILLALPIFFIRIVSAHSAFWHPSMWGFNVTDKTFDYDNRPVVPIKNMNFDRWWFHNHLAHPPNQGDFFELPAGQAATAEIACNKGATSYFASSEGGDIRDPNKPDDPCPHSPTTAYHANNLEDVRGCALAITYESDVGKVQPEDFTVFSVNHTCVWTRFTDFQVPKRMPSCPPGGCICAFLWIHSEKSGGEENYMNGFRCNVTSSSSDVALAKPQVPRRCGADPERGRVASAPGNCTYGAKQPLYWFQNERNNMFEGFYSPPFYNDLYNFIDGAQEDIFTDSYESLPAPAVIAPLPILASITVTEGGPNAKALALNLPVASPPSDGPSIASAPSDGPSIASAPSASSNPVSTPSANASPTGASTPVPSPQATQADARAGTCQFVGQGLNRRSFDSTPPTGLVGRIHEMLRSSRRLHPQKRSKLWSLF